MKIYSSTARITVTVSVLAICIQYASAQVVSWTFDEDGGSSIDNHGSFGVDYKLFTSNIKGSQADLRSAPGTGVSGGAGDRALDLTSAVQMGGKGPTVVTNSKNAYDVSSLHALTIAGWYRIPDGTEPSGAIFRCSGTNENPSGWSLWIGKNGKLQFSIGDGKSLRLATSTDAHTSGDGEWNFFAVAWDGNEAKFYQGNKTDAAQEFWQVPFKVKMNPGPPNYSLGQNNSLYGAFKGLLDHIDIFDKALSDDEIENLRKAALNPPK